MRCLAAIGLLLGALASTPTLARDYIVTSPDGHMTTISPTPGGGWQAWSADRPTTYYTPNPFGGGATITTPGSTRAPTYVYETPNWGDDDDDD